MKTVSNVFGFICLIFIGLYFGKLVGKFIIFSFGDLIFKLMYVNINWFCIFIGCFTVFIISYILKHLE